MHFIDRVRNCIVRTTKTLVFGPNPFQRFCISSALITINAQNTRVHFVQLSCYEPKLPYLFLPVKCTRKRCSAVCSENSLKFLIYFSVGNLYIQYCGARCSPAADSNQNKNDKLFVFVVVVCFAVAKPVALYQNNITTFELKVTRAKKKMAQPKDFSLTNVSH